MSSDIFATGHEAKKKTFSNILRVHSFIRLAKIVVFKSTHTEVYLNQKQMVKPPLETPNTAVTAVEIINGQTASVRSKAPTVKHSRSLKWELSVTDSMVYFTLSISGRDL